MIAGAFSLETVPRLGAFAPAPSVPEHLSCTYAYGSRSALLPLEIFLKVPRLSFGCRVAETLAMATVRDGPVALDALANQHDPAKIAIAQSSHRVLCKLQLQRTAARSASYPLTSRGSNGWKEPLAAFTAWLGCCRCIWLLPAQTKHSNQGQRALCRKGKRSRRISWKRTFQAPRSAMRMLRLAQTSAKRR